MERNILRIQEVVERVCRQQRSGCFEVRSDSRRIAMSLAEASETRKARLIALRKRKEGEAVDNNG